ncbi:putative glycoside hydrolase [Diaporthe ampelina]|uniref:Putative glycoside hydrolase n=1 Tax=Diaporthe ampelina TaxID=1214573 RepID=A0A0G2FD42_9PEZI|nr:putative glycoside hydrolase [Diaporthe ampelina]
MMLSASNIAAVLALSGATSAHMIMANPKPYGSPDNSPLTASNYPCKLSGDPATFYSTDGLSNTATAGESVKMSFTGSAVHGGGSCQVALSTDMQPSASTRWSVILSIEGGCPSKDGSSPSEYDVKIPADIPAGDYSYAWTWTSKLSGQPEYYMNCAPLTIQGGSGSKRRAMNIHQRADALDAYPPLAVYNLADINSCKSVLSSSPQYPVPGDNVEKLATSDPAFADITGDNCFATGVTYDGSSSSGGSSDSGSSSGSSGSGSGSGSATTPAAAPSATGSPSGFATSVAPATTSAAAAAPATPTGSGSSSGSGSSGSSTGGGSCTEGQSECSSDGTSYKMCVAGGEWSASMSVAAGTKCTPGTSSSLAIVATKQRRGLPLLF